MKNCEYGLELSIGYRVLIIFSGSFVCGLLGTPINVLVYMHCRIGTIQQLLEGAGGRGESGGDVMK